MKILFLTDNFIPEVNAPANRTYEHCKKWVEEGMKVTVITGFPNYPEGKIYEGYKNRLFQKETIEGIHVIRVWTFMAPNSGFFKRILDYISYAIMAFIFGLSVKFDIVIGTTPQFFTPISAYFLSVVKKRKFVIEIRDLWPESIEAVGMIKSKSHLYKLISIIQKFLYIKSNLIVVVTDSFKEHLINLTINPDKIIVIKNGVITGQNLSFKKDTNLISKLNLKNKFIVSYTGTIGMAHGLDFIIECIRQVKDKSIHFIFQGEGAKKKHIINIANDYNLKNITFLPKVPKKQIYKYILISDVALINLKKSKTFKSVIPSKIFENVLLRKPILLGLEGEAKKLIRDYDVGICYIPENKNSFLSSLEKIKSFKCDKNYYKRTDKMISNFDREKLALEMLKYLKTL